MQNIFTTARLGIIVDIVIGKKVSSKNWRRK